VPRAYSITMHNRNKQDGQKGSLQLSRGFYSTGLPMPSLIPMRKLNRDGTFLPSSNSASKRLGRKSWKN
jgi:hypothetical protein